MDQADSQPPTWNRNSFPLFVCSLVGLPWSWPNDIQIHKICQKGEKAHCLEGARFDPALPQGKGPLGGVSPIFVYLGNPMNSFLNVKIKTIKNGFKFSRSLPFLWVDFGVLILDLGIWGFDFGAFNVFWILDFRGWILDLGFWGLNFGVKQFWF